jgi:hypothetical protein
MDHDQLNDSPNLFFSTFKTRPGSIIHPARRPLPGDPEQEGFVLAGPIRSQVQSSTFPQGFLSASSLTTRWITQVRPVIGIFFPSDASDRQGEPATSKARPVPARHSRRGIMAWNPPRFELDPLWPNPDRSTWTRTQGPPQTRQDPPGRTTNPRKRSGLGCGSERTGTVPARDQDLRLREEEEIFLGREPREVIRECERGGCRCR